MKTILITGCSSGFGLETAKLFRDRGWKVIATMRTIRDDVLPKSPNLRVIALDVSDEASIAAAIKEAGEIVGLTGLVEHFGQVKNPYDTRLVTCSLWLGQSNRSSGR